MHKNTAYLMSWAEPDPCARGGVFVADISNPAQPKEKAFIPALPGSYHGEGAHAITLNTAAFKGDVLAVNNEQCSNTLVDDENEALAPGGFDLYDVSDPSSPKVLVQGFGDTGPDGGSLTGDDPFANSSHSSFLWQDGGKTYLVTVDNYELYDVDIFDVTDPRNPKAVGESTSSRSPSRRAPTSTTSSRSTPRRSSCTTWSSRRSAAGRPCSPTTGTRGTSRSMSRTRRTRSTSATTRVPARMRLRSRRLRRLRL